MNKRAKPFLIVGAFWLALFLFVMAGYSGSLGVNDITGFAVAQDGRPTSVGLQAMIIVILFFTNLLTLFFYIREIAD